MCVCVRGGFKQHARTQAGRCVCVCVCVCVYVCVVVGARGILLVREFVLGKEGEGGLEQAEIAMPPPAPPQPPGIPLEPTCPPLPCGHPPAPAAPPPPAPPPTCTPLTIPPNKPSIASTSTGETSICRGRQAGSSSKVSHAAMQAVAATSVMQPDRQ